MTPVSMPVVPPQPAGQVTYPVSKLYLFHEYDSAAQYAAAFAVQPPAFDPTRRQKTWFDSTVDVSDPLATVPYKAWRKNPTTSAWSLQVIAMPASEAATVNIVPPSSPGPAPLTPWEVPSRDLLPNEKPARMPMGLYIQNTDLLQQAEQDMGAFTAADRAMLTEILSLLQSLAAQKLAA